MPYRKINKKIKKKFAETKKHAADDHKLQPAATSIVSPTSRA
jgi:hypothetical protein